MYNTEQLYDHSIWTNQLFSFLNYVWELTVNEMPSFIMHIDIDMCS